MAAEAEDLQGTTSISGSERDSIEAAIVSELGSGYTVKVVGEPDQTAEKFDYVVAIIKKLAE